MRTLDELIEKLKKGESGEVDRAKENIKKAFNSEKEKKEAFKKILESLDDYRYIEREKNKIAFIYGLKLAAKERGREYFPLFTSFIIKNIQSDSGNVRKAVLGLVDSLIFSLFEDSKELSEEEKKAFTEFIDEILILLELHYNPEFEKYENLDDLPACKYKSLEMLLSRIMSPEKKDVKIYDKKAGMPKWMDCTWKRVPCMEDKCPICSRLKEIDEVSDIFDRGELLIEVADEAEEARDELPGPEEFPFYKEVRSWMEGVILTAEESKETGDFWIFTEEATELFWYVNVLSAKVYRQLCNKYLLENSEDGNIVDYRYTEYVLSESIKRIKIAIKEIILAEPTQKHKLNLTYMRLESLEEKILNI